jgi:transcriptional regulator
MMYVPEHFRMNDAEAAKLLASGSADVVASGTEGLEASFLPLLYEAESNSLTTHIAKINPFAKLDGAPAVALFHGIDAFISAKWVRDFEGDPAAASWNYLAVHAHGTLKVHTDPEWITAQTIRHSLALEPDFDVAAITEEWMDRQLRSMYGLELVIDRVEAKAKMSQNKKVHKIEQIIAGLREAGCVEVADWMEQTSLPRAIAKRKMLDEIRAAHS